VRRVVAALLAALPLQAVAVCSGSFPIAGSFVPYCDNGQAGPVLAIVIHGVNRDADRYVDLLPVAGRVIAPEFQAAGPGLYWSGGWSAGNKSLDATRTSSFAVVDAMVAAFGARTIVGHSAGGQFVTRYAALTPHAGLRFIVANPSSYLYLDSSRPYATTGCPDFNRYKYGLENPNSYASAGLAADYADRDVIYLLGELDIFTDANLDTTCPAAAQGPHRLARGQGFYAHLETYFGRQVHRLVIVPGVGHSGSAMLEAAAPYVRPAGRTCGACHL